MTIVECPGCGEELVLSGGQANCLFECDECGEIFRVLTRDEREANRIARRGSSTFGTAMDIASVGTWRLIFRD
jgi:uncharacterized Zn finger protein